VQKHLAIVTEQNTLPLQSQFPVAWQVFNDTCLQSSPVRCGGRSAFVVVPRQKYRRTIDPAIAEFEVSLARPSPRMFQPQPTPYAAFSSYGPANDQEPDHNAYNFQSAGLGLRSGGPIVFDTPIFNPVSDFRPPSLSVGQNRYGTMNTPPSDDMAAQEALARGYQPDLKVRGLKWEMLAMAKLTCGQGPLVGEKKSSMAITEEYAKADPIFVAKTSVGRSWRLTPGCY
jgi:hypothetical protein